MSKQHSFNKVGGVEGVIVDVKAERDRGNRG